VDLATVAQVEMQALAENLGMPVHIGVLNGPNVVYVAKAASPGFIQFDTYPGKIAPFNLTALGKAITAFLPEVELEALLPHLVPGRGPRALPAGRDAYLSDLATIRRKGFAVENEEDEEKIACVAVPFFDAEASVAGAVGVTGFARDMTGVTLRRAREQLVDLGAHISRRLGFDPGRTAGHTS
jgi:DNA-binding IclR family transcriptional regulator